MGDYLPPAGPPPPKVPPGWKAVWNEQYKEWFFVNLHTKASTWEKPTEPAYGPGDNLPPDGPPPAYHGDSANRPPEKGGFANNNPYGAESDEAMARRLQEEENRRVHGQGQSGGDRGEANSYYTGAPTQQYGASSGSGAYAGSSNVPPPDTGAGNKGLLSKLTGKLSSPNRPPQGYAQAPPNQYGGYPPQGYPPQGYPPQQYGGYPPQTQYIKKQKHGGGMGALGGAGLGLGAGLLGGAVLGSAMDGHDGGYHGGDDGGYDDGGGGGFDDGGFGGDDGGGDFGGGDFGGGDFGGGD